MANVQTGTRRGKDSKRNSAGIGLAPTPLKAIGKFSTFTGFLAPNGDLYQVNSSGLNGLASTIVGAGKVNGRGKPPLEALATEKWISIESGEPKLRAGQGFTKGSAATLRQLGLNGVANFTPAVNQAILAAG